MTQGKNTSFFKRSGMLLRYFDRYGSNVSLFYNRDTKFKTAFGGYCIGFWKRSPGYAGV